MSNKIATASICTIGDEILIGQITDTNSGMISRALGSIGIKTSSMHSIGDDHAQIVENLSELLKTNDIVITTGGLGPTKDDITKKCLAEISHSEAYIEHAGQMDKVYEILSSRGLEVLDINRAQALVPDTCEVIVNKRGTAPIMVFCIKDYPHTPLLIAMPGVPFETEAALPDVLNYISRHYTLESITHRHLMVYGYAESALAKKIATWEDNLPENMHLAYLPNPLSGVRLRLSIYGGLPEENEKLMEDRIAALSEILGNAIYSYEGRQLEEVIGDLLKSQNKTLSAAESCTGGEISHLVTTVPGSSSYYLGSVTSYAISVKEKILGVPHETIETHGVVSSEVAAAMAEGVRLALGSDFAVSTTGLAGPGGGDGVNPEGTVWVGFACASFTKTAKFNSRNDRKRNIERFSASALFFLLENMKESLNI